MAMEKGKKILGYAAIGVLAYAAYKVLKGKKPVAAAVEATKEAVELPVKAVKKAAKLIKGSPEAKAHMAALRAKAKAKRAAGGSHKGHATKRGLAQDQKLRSSEPHEKAYQKKKKIPI